MFQSGEAKLLRIFIGESDKIKGVPAYEKIVLLAREKGLAGATVTKGIMGFGKNSIIHTAKILRLSEDLPMIIEIVDKLDRIEDFINDLHNVLDESNCSAMLTMEKVEVRKYGQ